MTITKELIQQLREMEARATKGTWFARFAYQKDKNLEGLTLIGATAPGHAIVTSHEGGTSPSNDLELMVALRNNAKALLDEIERLQGENEALKSGHVQQHVFFHEGKSPVKWTSEIYKPKEGDIG